MHACMWMGIICISIHCTPALKGGGRIKEDETALKRTSPELDICVIFSTGKNRSKMVKMRLFHVVLVVMQIAALYPYGQHIWLPCGLLFELGGRMHCEIKGKIRWENRSGEIVVEQGLAGVRGIFLRSLQICPLILL